MINWDELIKTAKEAMKNAYAPYSHFKVGAAILADGNIIFTGCNVENASYGLTICAERTAVAKAVSEGHKKFSAIVVISDSNPPATPCGACRQVLAEFNHEMKVLCINKKGISKEYILSDLIPDGFDLKKKIEK